MKHLEKRLKQKETSDEKEAARVEHAEASKKYKVIVLGANTAVKGSKEERPSAEAVIVMAKSKEEALKEHKGAVKASEVSDKYLLPVVEKKKKK